MKENMIIFVAVTKDIIKYLLNLRRFKYLLTNYMNDQIVCIIINKVSVKTGIVFQVFYG